MIIDQNYSFDLSMKETLWRQRKGFQRRFLLFVFFHAHLEYERIEKQKTAFE